MRMKFETPKKKRIDEPRSASAESYKNKGVSGDRAPFPPAPKVRIFLPKKSCIKML